MGKRVIECALGFALKIMTINKRLKRISTEKIRCGSRRRGNRVDHTRVPREEEEEERQ